MAYWQQLVKPAIGQFAALLLISFDAFDWLVASHIKPPPRREGELGRGSARSRRS
jgi:hypothetical protein